MDHRTSGNDLPRDAPPFELSASTVVASEAEVLAPGPVRQIADNSAVDGGVVVARGKSEHAHVPARAVRDRRFRVLVEGCRTLRAFSGPRFWRVARDPLTVRQISMLVHGPFRVITRSRGGLACA